MSKLIHLGVLTISLVVGFCCPTEALACRGPIPSFEENVGKAAVIFEGVITKVSEVKPQSGAHFGHREFTFKTSRWWKGQPQSVVVVRSMDSSCGFRGDVGSRWIVLASGDPLSTWVLGGNIWLQFSDGRPTGNSADRIVKEFGPGNALER